MQKVFETPCLLKKNMTVETLEKKTHISMTGASDTQGDRPNNRVIHGTEASTSLNTQAYCDTPQTNEKKLVMGHMELGAVENMHVIDNTQKTCIPHDAMHLDKIQAGKLQAERIRAERVRAARVQAEAACLKKQQNAAPATQATLPLPPQSPFTVVRWRYRFHDFVTGPTNAVAVAAAKDICQSNGVVETLFVSAPPGLGKTHLIHAIGQTLAHEKEEMRVGYLTAEEFTSRFVYASRHHTMDAFKAALRDLDVLLLEDVHFFQGKEKTQDEALATIKSLQSKGSRLVLTSSFTPRELQGVDSHLVSYFCSGMLTSMEKPTKDMCRSILCNKARSFQVLLPEPVAEVLVDHLNTDVRQLESCLNNLIFKARHLNREICVELAMDVLSQYAKVEQKLDMDNIIRLVLSSFGMSEEQLCSRSQRKACVLARATAYYLARKHTDATLQDIASRFNRRHTTVLKGITSIEKEMQRQSSLGRQAIHAIQLIERNAANIATC